jgi:hypothetical protein
MRYSEAENLVARLMLLTLSIVTLVVFTQSVTDPVNVPKLFTLGAFSFATFGAALRLVTFEFLKNYKMPLFFMGTFIAASLSTLVASPAPLPQSIYGVYGRNNGFLLYLFLVLIFISTLTLTSLDLFRKYIVALAIAGIANVIYALWVIAFGDPIGWNNIYGNLLGTFGNPNFIGSFFGMFSAILFTAVISKQLNLWIRLFALLLLPLVFFGIVQTQAVQGKILFVAGAAMVVYFWIRDYFSSNLFPIVYLTSLFFAFLIALFGTLQKGPLAALLYKESISLRGEYWHAGWLTGLANPIFGAGFDSYGDWYRRSRRESALTLPGIDTVSNAAHNVFLDIFAFGGWPLFISYILIVLLVVLSIIRFTIANKKFDPIFVSLASVWGCYQLQSTISINQVGLAIWGWAFGAAIITYEKTKYLILTKPQAPTAESSTKKKKAKKLQKSVISPGLTSGLAAVIGMLIAVPPLSADMKWRSAQVSQDANRVEDSLSPGYLNPLSTFRFISTVGVFETNGLKDLAHKYALEAVKFNPNSFEVWRNLSQLSKVTNRERELALKNMKRLDPRNPQIPMTDK